MKENYTSVLTIAGSDSGGCAGIQADIKSISACGGFAASVITAITAQNTLGVTDIHPVPIANIEKQLDAVLSDIEFKAIKIGMLHSCEVIQVVRRKLASYAVKNIVLDPVMVATSGDRLIADDSLGCLKELLPFTTLITPNIPEAELLLEQKITVQNMEDSARRLSEKYRTSVLLKGGHLPELKDGMRDVLYSVCSNQLSEITHPYVETQNTHGTGCSLSSSLATYLALGFDLETAAQKACAYLNKALDLGKGKVLGKGRGPVNHFGI